MQLVLASSNSGKIREFKYIVGDEIKAFSEMVEPFEIVEDADSFAGNALIKAKAVYESLFVSGIQNSEYIVIADDSGISVPLLGGKPGIYSARYARADATSKENLNKLLVEVGKHIDRTPAYYTAAIAIVSKYGEYVVHGWMYGDVITEARGSNGFGYDPIFIPKGYDKTLAELDEEVKIHISHRAKALNLAKPIIALLQAYYLRS